MSSEVRTALFLGVAMAVIASVATALTRPRLDHQLLVAGLCLVTAASFAAIALFVP